MGELQMRFPGWDRQKLERIAVDRANHHLALTRGQLLDDPPVDRLVVRTCCGTSSPATTKTQRWKRTAACEAITCRYPWLAPECQQQIHTRAWEAEATQRALAEIEAEREAQAAARQERVTQSRAAIKRFRVGDHVTAKVKGRRREATVVKVGRTRLTVAFRLKDGAERSALVYASDVEPA